MALKLKDKSMVVTGAARGIGKAIAIEFARQGAHVVMSRTPIGRVGSPEEIGRIALFFASSLSSYIVGQTIYADGGRMALNQLVPVKADA